jgi:hypothetical protein
MQLTTTPFTPMIPSCYDANHANHDAFDNTPFHTNPYQSIGQTASVRRRAEAANHHGRDIDEDVIKEMEVIYEKHGIVNSHCLLYVYHSFDCVTCLFIRGMHACNTP